MKTFNSIIVLLFGFSVNCVTAIALNDTIVIDLGKTGEETVGNWNNYSLGSGILLSAGDQDLILDLKRFSDNAGTGVNFVKREDIGESRVGIGNVTNNVGLSESFPESGSIPATASEDLFYVQSDSVSFALTNLNAEFTYDLTIHSANQNDRDPITFMVNGVSKVVDPNVAPYVITWSDVVVDSSNEIVLSFSGLDDSSVFKDTHINAIELTATASEEILILDLRVPNKITISSTEAFASAEVTGLDTIYFDNFYFGADNPAGELFGTRLDFANDGSSLTTVDPDPELGIEPPADYAEFYRDAGNDPGMALSDWTTYSTINFFTDVRAFIGASTWDLDPGYYDAMLAGGNRSGDIYFEAYDVGDTATATVVGQYRVVVSPSLHNFSYDPSTNTFNANILGAPNTSHIVVEADDLDFGNPDQSPVPLTGASSRVGSLSTLDNTIQTNVYGNASVEGVSLGVTPKDATFIRLEDQ